MSHLVFPRLHFRGQFSTNPGTANNDDLGNPPFVDTALVRVDTIGMTDADFANWIREIEPGFGIRGGWNLYGDSSCSFNNAACHSTELDANAPNTTTAMDSAIGGKVSLLRGVMVDQDPEGTTSTQIFAAQFSLSAPGGVSIIGRPSRAYSRWVARKNLGVSGFRAYSTVWHCVINPPSLTIAPGSSPVLKAFLDAKNAGNGLFIRYCTYLLAPLLSATRLAADFAAGRATTNPAVGIVLGTVGIWQPTEMTTLAMGRRLGSGATITSDHVDFQLNPATVYVDAAKHRVSVDLINSIPERDETLEKVNLGPMDLTLTTAGGSIVLGTIPNTRSDYELRAGLLDFDVPPALMPDVAGGRLAVVQRSTSNSLLAETELVFETEDRAVYLQEGNAGTITLRGWLRGQPAGHQRVLISQFSTTDKTFAAVPPATAIVNCPPFVDLDGSGTAQIAVTAVSPGCGTLRFADPGDPTADEFFACVRVLPRDDFTAIPDAQLTFQFIYESVLKYYHLLHPAMDVAIPTFDLSVEADVIAHADRIRTRIRDTAWGDSQYMPRTRELSAGKQALLLRWCEIVSPEGP